METVSRTSRCSVVAATRPRRSQSRARASPQQRRQSEPRCRRQRRVTSGSAALATLLLAARADAEPARTVVFERTEQHPHETKCFTEGLFFNGTTADELQAFESCGMYGHSFLRVYSPTTGETQQQADISRDIFAEGIALIGNSLYMLTYHKEVLIEFDARTLKELHRHPWTYGEGWGMTTDGCDLLATTGSPYIFRLRPEGDQLRLVNKVLVTHDGQPVKNLNELEYVTPKVWVNEWLTSRVWRVDPLTGVCDRKMEIGDLHRWQGDATPNGIGYSPVFGENTLVLTGKNWPYMFRLRLSQSDLCGDDGALPLAPSCTRAPPSACWHPPAVAAEPVAALPAAAAPSPQTAVSATEAPLRSSLDPPAAQIPSLASPAPAPPPPNEGATAAAPSPQPQAGKPEQSVAVTLISLGVAALLAILALALPWWICKVKEQEESVKSGRRTGPIE